MAVTCPEGLMVLVCPDMPWVDGSYLPGGVDGTCLPGYALG